MKTAMPFTLMLLCLNPFGETSLGYSVLSSWLTGQMMLGATFAMFFLIESFHVRFPVEVEAERGGNLEHLARSPRSVLREVGIQECVVDSCQGYRFGAVVFISLYVSIMLPKGVPGNYHYCSFPRLLLFFFFYFFF